MFDAVAQRTITIEVGRRFPLSEVAKAHRALESRQTTASTVLVPD
ncbi:MAG: zinc-binding dehydrogenase [Gammaproteobacteria bacterium]|nr:zinc-binding dehydrogenase [Gammaproteobacteria bacterium]